MTNLWRGAAAVAIISGALAGCASPRYPITASQTPGTGALSAPKPQYPIAAAAQPPAPAPMATPAEAPPAPPPLAAPVAKVESQSLPPPTEAAPAAPASSTAPQMSAPAPAASQAGAPTAAETGGPAQPAPAPAETPGPSASSTPTASPTAATATTPAPTPVVGAPATTPAAVAQPSPAPTSLTTQPVRGRYDEPSPRSEPSARSEPVDRAAISGQVVDAGGDVFENYEVRRGDHIDELARAFSTSRGVLLSVNHVRAPYVIHPGEIVKVPVAKAYVAESGDTLAGVARRFQVDVSELAELNHLSERAPLRAGQHIGLPSSMRDRGPQRGYAASATYAEPAPRRASYGYGYVTPAAHPGLTPLNPSPSVVSSSPVTSDRGAGYQAAPSPASVSQAPGISDAEISAAAKGKFVWPVRGGDIVARFGPTGVGRRNDGVDIKAAQGSTVIAAAPGEVVYAGDQVPGFGNLVLIKHADGWVTAYAHLDQVSVQMKDQVTQGQTVGTVGESGGVAEPELHFEVRYAPTPADKARPVDPALVLPQG